MADFVASAEFQDNLSAGMNAAAAALNNAAAAADKLDATVTKVGPSATTLARRYDDVTAAAVKLQKAQDLLRTATATMDAAVAAGTATTAQRNTVVDNLSAKVQALSATTAAAVPVTNQLTDAHGKAATGAAGAALAHAGFTREIVVLGHEIISGNFSRIPGSMIVLAERSGELTNIIKALGSAVFGLPGAAAAAAAGIVYLGYEAETGQRQLLALQTQLRATRDDFTAMATEATKAARAVAGTTGFGGTDTKAAAQTIVSVPSFVGDQQALQNLILTAGDLAAVMGATLPEAAVKLAEAMKDPAKIAQEWAASGSFGMTQALADQIKVLQDSGDKAGAFGLDLDALKAKTSGAAVTSKTELQQALHDLGDAFTGTGADGKSFAQVLGTYVTTAAADALAVITGIVNGINAVRVAINTPASAPSQSVLTNSVSGTQGIFQLAPATAAGLHVNPADAQQNIFGGLTYIQQLQQQYAGTTGTNGALAQYGGYGHDVAGAAGYINKVQTADTSVLNGQTVTIGGQTMTTAQAIQFWGQSLGLDQKTIDLGMRIATVESGGRQFGGALAPAAVASSPGGGVLPTPPIPSAGDANGIANTSLVNDAIARADKANTPIAAALAAGADVKLYTTALADLAAQGDTSSDSVVKLQQALQKAQVAFQDAKTPADVLIDSLARQAAGQDLVANAYAQGGDAVTHATNLVRAEEEARKMAGVTTENYALTVLKLSAGYDSLTASQEHNKAASQESDQGQQLQYLQAELSTLGETTAARAHDLAILKEKQAIQKNLPDLEQSEKDKLVANAAAIADATSNLAQQQATISAIGGALTQIADQLGQAITNSFVSGTGAAVNWGNVTRAVIASVLQELIKLAVINPLLNAALGSSNATLGSVFSLAGGGSSGGSAGSGGSSGISLSSISQYLGLGSSVSGALGGPTIGSALGLTGEGGLFSGAASGGIISSGLNYSLIAPTTAYEGSITAGATGIDGVASATGGATIGSALSGVGLGYGVGSLAGGFVQSSLGKVGPAPEIGAGVGAAAGAAIGSIIPGIGTIIGGLIGGLIGGGGGGLIGPSKPNSYSQIGITSSNGRLSVGNIYNQAQDDSAFVSATQQGVASTNAFLDQTGVSVASVGTSGDRFTQRGTVFKVGNNNGAVDSSEVASLDAGFSKLNFKSADPLLNNVLAGQSFASLAALETAVTTFQAAEASVTSFLTNTVPPLTATATATGTLSAALAAAAAPYDAAIAQAKALEAANASTADQTAALVKSETDLANARDAATKTVQDAVNAQLAQTDAGFQASYLSALATVTGNPGDAKNAQLYAFDQTAKSQEDALTASLTNTFGDSYKTSQAYADQMALLEKSLGEQRLAIQQQYLDKITAAANQTTATAVASVTSLSAYVLKLQTGNTSPLSPTAQYGLASSQFNAVAGAARAGDFKSYSGIQTYADSLLSTSQAVNGSGAKYTADFNRVLDVLTSLAGVTPDTLTASVFASQTQTQTAALVDSLAGVRAEVAALRQAVNAPARIAR